MTDNKLVRIFKWLFFIAAFLLLLFVVVFSFTGCLDKQELDELTVVSGVAVDSGKNSAGGLPPVTAHDRGQTPGLNMAVEFVTISSEGTTGKNVEGQILQLQGLNAFSALREALSKSQNKLYLVHNQLLIFGRDVAEEGLREHIDFFVRDYEARLNVPLLIADGTAAEILQTKGKGTGLTSEYLKNMSEVQAAQGLNVFTKMLDFTNNIVSWEKGTLVPMVRVSKENEEEPQLVMDSTAVFVEDTMVGTLDRGQTRGVLWVMGLIKEGLINLETSQGKVVVEITGSKVDKSIQYEDDKLKVTVDILQMGVIGSATDGAGYNFNKNIDEIQKATEKAIKKEILSGYEALKALNCDAYGFGDTLRRTQHKTWEKLTDNWKETFKNIDFTVNVESTIDNTGALDKNI